jgi:6-phosphogluconolactonase/glucosamine-6-phosphate isomerase/deaminase
MITHSYSDISHWFVTTIQNLLQKQETVTIALPGGHSLDGWYASVLSNSDVWKGIDIARIRWCLVDERCVSEDSSDRNDIYIWETFLKPLKIDKHSCLCL